MYDKKIKDFVELAASEEPVPGGGSVSAICASLASSLASMVTNLTIGKKKYLEYTSELEDIRLKANELKDKLLECANEDAKAFYPLSKAYSYDKNSPNYLENLENCLKDAAQSPLNIMKYTVEIIKLDSRLADIGSKLSVSDAGTSVMLALGALYGAYTNVIVNTRLMNNKEYANNLEAEAKKLLEYEDLARYTYKRVLERL